MARRSPPRQPRAPGPHYINTLPTRSPAYTSQHHIGLTEAVTYLDRDDDVAWYGRDVPPSVTQLTRMGKVISWIDRGGDINTTSISQYKFTLLIEACIHNHESLVAELVKRGANLDMKAKGKTALHYAVLNVHPNCAKPLLDAGARTDIRVDVDDSDFTEADGMTAMEIVEDKLLVAREPISHQLRLLKKMLRQAEAGLPVDSFLKEEVSEDLKHFGGARANVYNWGP